MDTYIDQIRAAVTDGATPRPEARRRRRLPRHPRRARGPARPAHRARLAPVATGPGIDQVLDLLIARLQTMVAEPAASSASPATAAARSLAIPMVATPPGRLP